jgi:hypothetical protein
VPGTLERTLGRMQPGSRGIGSGTIVTHDSFSTIAGVVMVRPLPTTPERPRVT